MNKRYTEQDNFNLLSKFAQRIAEMPEDDLLAEMELAGQDPLTEAAAVTNLIDRVLRQDVMRRARAEYEREVVRVRQFAPQQLPATPDERRNLLDQLITARAGLGRSALTAQFRDLSALSDSDVSSLLHNLLFLLDEPEPTNSSEEVESPDNSQSIVYDEDGD